MINFGEFEKLYFAAYSVTRHVTFIKTKIGEKSLKFKWDIFGDFQTLWMRKEARAPHLTRVNNH